MIDNKRKVKTGWNLDNSYLHLPNALYTRLNPQPVPSPKLILFNHDLAVSLGLNGEELKGDGGEGIFSGNRLPEGAMPLAQAYAGHQFGHFTILGDGRALLLGEQITPSGDRFDIQLKGSGPTPYSRGGDGRAALGPMLREYIISEAMHALGIPTTRGLAVVTTGETVVRETMLPGAILTRVAASHLRVGTFQYVAERCTAGELRSLADYTIQRHFPDINSNDNRYFALLQEAIKRQAYLIAKWQQVGFIHGVMNTDNMALSGETIDYGPCAFMDTYDPNTVFSSIDHQGRYAYGNQPFIGGWDLARFAETLLPLLHPETPQAIKLAQDAISEFSRLYKDCWLDGMRAKLGIFNQEMEDESLIDDLLNTMEQYHLDYTNTFVDLTFEKTRDTMLHGTSEFHKWYEKWQARLSRQEQGKDDSHRLMRNNNPAIIPRNHQVEAALEAAEKEDDLGLTKLLMAALAKPYAHVPEQAKYATPPTPSERPYRTFCGT